MGVGNRGDKATFYFGTDYCLSKGPLPLDISSFMGVGNRGDKATFYFGTDYCLSKALLTP
jgi:hypothetical protein